MIAIVPVCPTRVLVGVVALLVACAVRGADLAYDVAGLDGPAEIRIDQWGVPHIYAATQDDAFFVQGFNAARDRLWQIDLWRRRGLGELAAVLGAEYAAADRAARLFLYRGDLYREWLAYSNDAKRVSERFVAGINAYLDLIAQQPTLLPPEFELLGYRPARWAAADLVRIRSHGLWRNVEAEVARARVRCRFDASVDAVRSRLEPDWQPVLADGVDLCAIPDDVLADYQLAKRPVAFGRAVPPASAQRAHDSRLGLGSNNWAVAPARTVGGRPILANDPHRGHAVPSLRYIVHLKAPGLDVIGAGEPALPGISIGHNESIAFGLTIFAIDQEDLYVYETDKSGTRYRYRGQWRNFEDITQTIQIRGAAAQRVMLRFTQHGPVVAQPAGTRRAYAVRAAWLEPGMAPYFGSIDYMRATDWRSFHSALNRWGGPSENQVFADVQGNIGYKPAGLFPRRLNWDGLLPVPGDGRYEWQGYFDMDALPETFNPARGFVATANAMNLPPTYPIASQRVGFEWSAPWRARRLQTVLAQQPRHSVGDSVALQRDYHSTLADAVLAAALPALTASPATDLLRSWDRDLGPQSAPAALFMVWYERHLRPAMARWLVPPAALDLVEPMDSRVLVDTLTADVAAFGPMLNETLAAAWAETSTLLGTDSAQWRWGTLHQIRFMHPLQELATGTLAEQMRYPALPRGGSADTPNNTGSVGSSFDVAAGASFRMVLDVGNWDGASMTNAPGQSGDPRSPFYGNLLAGWAADDAFPLVYSDVAVLANTVATIRLTPARTRGDQ